MFFGENIDIVVQVLLCIYIVFRKLRTKFIEHCKLEKWYISEQSE